MLVKMRGKLALLAVAAVCLFCFFSSGCCLTKRMWQVVADEPQGIQGASVTEDHVLHLAVRYEDGRVWHLEAPLRPGPEWLRTTARVASPSSPCPSPSRGAALRPGSRSSPCPSRSWWTS